MAKLTVEQMLVRAQSHLKKGELSRAHVIYANVLRKFPKNKKAQQGLSRLTDSKTMSSQLSPPQEVIDKLMFLFNQGELEVVGQQARNLIAHYPRAVILWNILGIASAQNRHFEQAITAFRKITALMPKQAIGYYNLGNVLKDSGRINDAIEAFTKALELKPDYTEAYNNLNIALSSQGNMKTERQNTLIQNYQLTTKKKAKTADKLFKEGVVKHKNGKLEQAISDYTRALEIWPKYAEAYSNMGNALVEQGKLKDAIEAYDKAVKIKPEYEAAQASKLYRQACICDLESIVEHTQTISSLGVSDKIIPPFSVLPLEDAPDRHLLRSKNYSRSEFSQKELPLPLPVLRKAGRIRLAYFSTDFKEHPVSYLLAKVLEQHDRDRFEIFGYSLHGKDQSNIRQRIEKSFDNFQDVEGISDLDIAHQARKDEIDIAVDLNGFTQNARTAIFAYRAAPIQINYLGYPGTLGADFIDYIIADTTLIPDQNQKYFSEKPIYLPNTYMPTDDSRVLSQKEIMRSDLGLPEDAFVFCCFNNNYKISSAEFDIWMRILSKVPNSVLWLRKSNSFSHINLSNEAIKRKIDPSRIIFAEKMPMPEHLARHRLADLFIDTFAFNAHTTATEALWAGLPVVTKLGQGFAARVAASLLNAVGLPELITKDEKEYENLILTLASKPRYLAKIKEKLLSNLSTHPLFDTEQYTKHLEDGFQQAYNNYYAGNPPMTIIVPK